VKKYITCSGFIILFLALVLTSCKKKKAEAADTTTLAGNYFSIKQYALDEWNTFAHSPFTIVKTVKVNNGPTDSSYTNSDTINWAPIFKTFFETDISDRKFLGKYTFTQFDDNQDGTHNFFYEIHEDEDELFTRKLLITIDQYTRRVKGIYIETNKKTIFNECTQKLYYKPMKTIQIQTDNKPMVGSNTLTIVQYDFLL
jgi:hypothetical protein